MAESVKPQLLFINPNQFGYHTDSYKYCEHLRNSFNIYYLCFDLGYERLTLQDVKVFYMPFNTGKLRRLLHFYHFLIQLTRKEKFEAVFTVQFKFCFITGLFAKSKVKILDYRSGDLKKSTLKRKLKNRFLWLDSLFFKNVSVISEGVREIVHLKREKALILPLGADVISDQPHSYERMDLLYVGSFGLRNIHQTIEGLALFVNSNKDLSKHISYTIIGFGNKQDEEVIINTIEKSGLKDIVRFEGRKKYTDLTEYFNRCNIGISYVPITPYYDYQPVTKTFEYALSGLYTIATNTYENRQVISEQNGVLCNDNAESFAEALEKINAGRKHIKEADIRTSVLNYRWSVLVGEILQPYLCKLIDEANR